jgi:hypothetical protein
MHLTLKKETTKPAAANFLQQRARFDGFIEIFNTERPHEALDVKCPAEGRSIDVLFESLNFMVRATLIKIMRQKMLKEFRDGASASAYFNGFGLVNSQLQRKKKAAKRDAQAV